MYLADGQVCDGETAYPVFIFIVTGLERSLKRVPPAIWRAIGKRLCRYDLWASHRLLQRLGRPRFEAAKDLFNL